VVTTSFSDNLKDASDPSLRKVASRAFGKLTGAGASGSLIVHAGSGGGSVLVDGMVKGNLHTGMARVDVGEGAHKVAVHVSGFDAKEQDATVAAGSEQELSFALEPAPPSIHETPERASESFPVQKALGWTALVVGVGALAGAGVSAYLWVQDSNKSNDDRQHVPANISNVCATAAGTWATYAEDACKMSKDAQNVSTAAWALGVGGGVLAVTGIILLATDHHSSEAHESGANRAPSFEVLPAIGLRGGTVDVRVTF
jgi:hypothetical protein